DPELDRRVRQTYAGDQPRFQRPIDFEAHGLAGAPLTVIARDEFGHIAKAQSEVPLAVAEKRPLTRDVLRDQLGRLGGTAYRIRHIESKIEGDLILPVSELNRVRRELVAELD